jgi:hypothetical protein
LQECSAIVLAPLGSKTLLRLDSNTIVYHCLIVKTLPLECFISLLKQHMFLPLDIKYSRNYNNPELNEIKSAKKN